MLASLLVYVTVALIHGRAIIRDIGSTIVNDRVIHY
jgi:hypothetical protein